MAGVMTAAGAWHIARGPAELDQLAAQERSQPHLRANKAEGCDARDGS